MTKTTCRDLYISTLKYSDTRTNINYQTYEIGYQRLNYAVNLKKGNIICIQQDQGNNLAIRKNVSYPDLRIGSTTEFWLSDFDSNSGIYFNVIINVWYYFVIVNLEKKYPVDSNYNITAEFSDRRFSITELGSVSTGLIVFSHINNHLVLTNQLLY